MEIIMRVKELIKRLQKCNPTAIIEIQVQNKLVICDYENDKPIYEDEWFPVDTVQQDNNKEFVTIVT
tara:strand:+ start:154 stop:354 length:201 start_codon:yes stop_codon:yes gene_type:complete